MTPLAKVAPIALTRPISPPHATPPTLPIYGPSLPFALRLFVLSPPTHFSHVSHPTFLNSHRFFLFAYPQGDCYRFRDRHKGAADFVVLTDARLPRSHDYFSWVEAEQNKESAQLEQSEMISQTATVASQAHGGPPAPGGPPGPGGQSPGATCPVQTATQLPPVPAVCAAA